MDYQQQLNKCKEFGTIESVRHPLVKVKGLPGVTIEEVVVFESNQLGYVTSLKRDYVEVILLANEPVHPRYKVTRTNSFLNVEVGPHQRGLVLNALGDPISNTVVSPTTSEKRPLFANPPHIGVRTKITRPFITGTSMIDLMLPLGAGQRQVVCGDQKTGKTSLLLSVLKAHSHRGIVIYAAIGKPRSAIKSVNTFIANESKQDNTIVVASAADEAPSLISLTPFTAMSIAEYWRDAGQDVLVIFDDLSTHAKFYRETALLGGRFPGRQSYPGDIFHYHARLLERAGHFKHPKKPDGASITCLPVAETIRSDLASYIVSNLISITDGHFLFNAALFQQGQRPAMDTGLSVTRVGRQTQPRLLRHLHRELLKLLNQHKQALQFTRFGAELSTSVKNTLIVGERFNAFLSQPTLLNIPLTVQVIMATIIWQGWLNKIPEEQVSQWRNKLTVQYNTQTNIHRWFDQLIATDDLATLIKNLDRDRDRLVSLCQIKTPSPKK